MNKKFAVVFILSFVAITVLLQTIGRVLNNEQSKIDAQQISIIQENVKDRFKLYMQMPLSLAIIGSDSFAENKLTNSTYGKFFDHVLRINKEILGLNIVDENGKITAVYPARINDRATGKVSQNTAALKKSAEHGEDFWLSPPFKLYQGEVGFAFYVPIIKEKKLSGWFATVITTREFVEHFSLQEFLKTYELNIKDVESGEPYFATALSPDNGNKIYESVNDFFGRKLAFVSWRKTHRDEFSLPWYWLLLFSFVGAGAITQIAKIMDQRKRSSEQLADIGILLRLTSNEALSNLVDAESHSPVETPEQTGYLNNLLEQINLLQTMAKDSGDLYQDRFSFTDTIKEQIRNFSEIISKKKIELDFMAGTDDDIITANKWLIEHSVVNNILSHAIVQARAESKLIISSKSSREFVDFIVEVPQIQEKRLAINWDRRMEVARKTLNIYGGDLSIENNETRGMILHLSLRKS